MPLQIIQRFSLPIISGGILVCGVLLAVLTVFAGGPLGLAGLVGMAAMALMVFTHPMVPFCLYFGMLFFKADTMLPGLPISPNQILAPLFFLSVCVYAVQGKALSLRFALLPLLVIVAAYFIINGLLGIDSDNGILYARYVLIYLVLSICLAVSLSSERAILAFSWIVVLLTAAAAVGGLVEAFSIGIFGAFAGNWGYGTRVQGTAANPIVFAWNMVFAFPFAFFLFAESRSKYTRGLAIVLGVLILGVSALTFNRQTYVVAGIVVVLCAALYIYKNRAIFLSLLSVLVAISAFTVLPLIIKRLLTVGNLSKDYSFLERRDSYLMGMEMFRDFPIFGVGFGSFSKIWHEYIPPDYPTYFAQYRGANELKFMDLGIMAVMVETGIVGLLLFFALVLTIFFKAWRYRRQAIAAQDNFARNLSSTVLVVLVFIVVTSIIQDTFLYTRIWIFYGVALLLDTRQLPLRRKSDVDGVGLIGDTPDRRIPADELSPGS